MTPQCKEIISKVIVALIIRNTMRKKMRKYFQKSRWHNIFFSLVQIQKVMDNKCNTCTSPSTPIKENYVYHLRYTKARVRGKYTK